MEADIEFVAPSHREISAYQSKGIPVYAYSFDYLPESPIYEEEKKIFSLFGKTPIDIVRKDANFAGEITVFAEIYLYRLIGRS